MDLRKRKPINYCETDEIETDYSRYLEALQDPDWSLKLANASAPQYQTIITNQLQSMQSQLCKGKLQGPWLTKQITSKTMYPAYDQADVIRMLSSAKFLAKSFISELDNGTKVGSKEYFSIPFPERMKKYESSHLSSRPRADISAKPHMLGLDQTFWRGVIRYLGLSDLSNFRFVCKSAYATVPYFLDLVRKVKPQRTADSKIYLIPARIVVPDYQKPIAKNHSQRNQYRFYFADGLEVRIQFTSISGVFVYAKHYLSCIHKTKKFGKVCSHTFKVDVGYSCGKCPSAYISAAAKKLILRALDPAFEELPACAILSRLSFVVGCQLEAHPEAKKYIKNGKAGFEIIPYPKVLKKSVSGWSRGWVG